MPGPTSMPSMILMCARLWDDLGLDGIELQINSASASRKSVPGIAPS